MLCQGMSEKSFGVSAAMEPCKSRLRLRPIVLLLRQGIQFPAARQAEVTLLFRHWQLLRQTQVRVCANAHRLLRERLRTGSEVESKELFSAPLSKADFACDLRRMVR